MQSDRRLTAFRQIVPHLRGALWWIRNDLLKVRQPQFNQNDKHKGHPGLSVRKSEVTSVCDAVPMLAGTSKARYLRKGSVVVSGLTAKDRKARTFFGTIVEPARYSVGEMIEASQVKNERLRRKSWYKYSSLRQNFDKPMVDENEMRQLEEFCRKHRLG